MNIEKMKSLVTRCLVSADVGVSFDVQPLKTDFNTGERLTVRLRKGTADVEVQFDAWRGYTPLLSVYFRNAHLLTESEVYDTAYIMRLVVSIRKNLSDLNN